MAGFRVIREASITVLNLCDIQNYIPDRRYKQSDYVYRCTIGEIALYYSCLTGELIEVTDLNDAFKYMVNHWFFVGEEYNEKENAPKLRKLMLALEKKEKPGYNQFEILTTTNCNASCMYCYEHGYERTTMNRKIAIQVVNYIKNYLWGKEANILWYGGEPLMNIQVIDEISEGLSRNGVSFSSKMISNGYLFSKQIIEKAKNRWNLKNVRITFDGLEQTHNKVKQYKGVSLSPFIRTIENVELLLDANISVTIRINVESHNVDEIPDLLDQMCELFGKTDLLDYMIRPLNNTRTLTTIESDENNRRHILNRIDEIKKYLFENDYNVNSQDLKALTSHTCYVDNRRYLLIKPNGGLSFCPEFFENNQFGTIGDDSLCIRPANYYEYKYDKGEVCNNCPLYINCYPNQLCPAFHKSVCDEMKKNSIIRDLELSIRNEYRKYMNKNKGI